MRYSVSCGYCPSINACSASAIRLAGTKCPRRGIENERSSNSAVAASGPPKGVLVVVLDGRPGVVAAERAIELLVVVHPLQGVDGGGHGHGLLARRERGLAPGQVREHAGQVAAQPVRLEGQVHVL